MAQQDGLRGELRLLLLFSVSFWLIPLELSSPFTSALLSRVSTVKEDCKKAEVDNEMLQTYIDSVTKSLAARSWNLRWTGNLNRGRQSCWVNMMIRLDGKVVRILLGIQVQIETRLCLYWIRIFFNLRCEPTSHSPTPIPRDRHQRTSDQLRGRTQSTFRYESMSGGIGGQVIDGRSIW